MPQILISSISSAEDDATSTPASPRPKVTQRVNIDAAIQISPEETAKKRLVVGLFGESAPVATANFVSLSSGSLDAPCREDTSAEEAMQRGALTKRGVFRQCLAEEARPVTYTGSQGGDWQPSP